MIRLPLRSTLFPYTTLFRSHRATLYPGCAIVREFFSRWLWRCHAPEPVENANTQGLAGSKNFGQSLRIDRKSTRLNSSHLGISYAVFCLKKKKKKNKKQKTEMPRINDSTLTSARHTQPNHNKENDVQRHATRIV